MEITFLLRYTPLPLFYTENLLKSSKNLYLSVFRFKTLESGSKISKVVKILIILCIENIKFTYSKKSKLLLHVAIRPYPFLRRKPYQLI